MANPLLDFVMSVVRDPDVAAHYAADPAGAIADANLTGVTTADVAHLIPVVTESMGSLSSAAGGVPAFGADPGANVWASGAATAAFDAFDDFGAQVPATTSPAGHLQLLDTSIHQVISDPGAYDAGGAAGTPVPAGLPVLATSDDPGLHSDVPLVDSAHVQDPAAALDWHHTVDTDPTAGAEHHPGIDFFS
ncbi:hypothetical protein ABIA30_002973 [Mycobacterium sp. MAA66]|uniref:Rv0340 family IniB-related protein n=1 Tax=Mycobacterium sp. MAA66 TaxID=3156297 RepID=UPI0035128087